MIAIIAIILDFGFKQPTLTRLLVTVTGAILAISMFMGSMEHLNEKLRYNRLLKNRNADLTAFLFFLDFKAPKLSGTIERKVAVSL